MEKLDFVRAEDSLFCQQIRSLVGTFRGAVAFIHHDMLEHVDEVVDDLKKIVLDHVLSDRVCQELFCRKAAIRRKPLEMPLDLLGSAKDDVSVNH